MIIAGYFEEIENTKTDICAGCKIEIVGKKYQFVLRVGKPTDIKAYDLFLCAECEAMSDTKLFDKNAGTIP